MDITDDALDLTIQGPPTLPQCQPLELGPPWDHPAMAPVPPRHVRTFF